MKENLVNDRCFEMMTAPDPTDQFHRVRIECSHKGCAAAMIFSRRGKINPVQAAKWFRDKGWHVGGHQRADLCPEHKVGNGMKRGPKPKGYWIEALAKEAALVDEMSNKNPAQVFDPLTEAVGLEMSRADKRIIYSKLDEVYADETTGYRGNWCDEKVASDLGVPKQWVTDIREDAFGPAYTRQTHIDGIRLVGVEIEKKLEEYLTSATLVEESKKDYDRLVAHMERQLEDFNNKAIEVTVLAMEFNKAMKELESSK